MPPWLSHISDAIKKESMSHNSRWIQLSTIGLDNSPRVRTVVFRGWNESYEMEIFSDKRSQKYYELELNNKVEICWLFSKSNCQFRLRGTCRIDIGKDVVNYWNQIDDKSKSIWGWPCPGELAERNQNKDKVKKLSDNLENFILISININQVDKLLLEKPMHIRRRWKRDSEWVEELINP